MLSDRIDNNSKLDDKKEIKESVFLFSLIPDNDFIKNTITELCNRSIGSNQTMRIQLQFSLHAPNENKFYQDKYQQHFPNTYSNNSSINWHNAFLAACEKEYTKLNPVMRQLFMLTKEKDIMGIKHTLNAQPIHLTDVLAAEDSNGKSMLEWVCISNDQDFKNRIFDEVGMQFCLAKSRNNISELDINDKNTLFSFAVGLHQTKQKLMELKDAGADINHIHNGRTPLGGAITALEKALAKSDDKIQTLRDDFSFVSQEKANLEGQVKQLYQLNLIKQKEKKQGHKYP